MTTHTPPARRLIDFHTHAWPDALAPAAVATLLRQAGDSFSAHYDGSVLGLLGAMESTGVGISVIQPVATKPGQVVTINDWAASIHDERLIAFGAMHPDFPDVANEMARIKRLGLKGVKLHPEHQKFVPDEDRVAAIFEAACANDLIVMSHAGADEIHPDISGTVESFLNVAERWPDLRLVLAHLGGYRQWDLVAQQLAGSAILLDTAYTLGHLPDAEWIDLVRSHGVDRVMFGSDGPWTDVTREIEYLGTLGFSEDELDALCYRNAARLLDI